jgi:hypothetical protein
VVRHVPLQLNALHPDRAAGLGFLSGSAFAFQPALLAHTIALAGILGGKIWNARRAVQPGIRPANGNRDVAGRSRAIVG